MKRKIVQHGPSTLTVSLPAKWIKGQGIEKGDEVNIELVDHGLFLSTTQGAKLGKKRIDVSGMNHLVTKAISALYKRGYDEIVVNYASSDELKTIHEAMSSGYIGFEIVDEKNSEVRIKKVSEPSEEEFKTLFRRIFHFLVSISREVVDAMESHDLTMYQRLMLRDQNINKLSDFCRRVINKHVQNDYSADTALYHVVEQLEKVGDEFKYLNEELGKLSDQPSDFLIHKAKEVHEIVAEYEKIFFAFRLVNMDALVGKCRRYLEDVRGVSRAEFSALRRLDAAVEEIYNLSGATMILHL